MVTVPAGDAHEVGSNPWPVCKKRKNQQILYVVCNSRGLPIRMSPGPVGIHLQGVWIPDPVPVLGQVDTDCGCASDAYGR